MTAMMIGRAGELTLPADIQERCGLGPETAVRLIETRSGILRVPLTDAPMSAELSEELQGWQSLGQEAWAEFPYEEDEEYKVILIETRIGRL